MAAVGDTWLAGHAIELGTISDRAVKQDSRFSALFPFRLGCDLIRNRFTQQVPSRAGSDTGTGGKCGTFRLEPVYPFGVETGRWKRSWQKFRDQIWLTRSWPCGYGKRMKSRGHVLRCRSSDNY
jgi:hypothetical protein